MEGFIEQKSDGREEAAKRELSNEALEFVNEHRDFFEHYARGKVDFRPAPKRLDTFAFDLEKNCIYINPRFYKERGLSDEQTSFATLHEVEHLLEKTSLLAEEGGERVFNNYLGRLKKSRAYGLMDNCIADVRENRTVVKKTSASFGELEQKLYREDFFRERDFTAAPKHIQFSQAILREARVPDEECVVAPAVREKLNALREMKDGDGRDYFSIFTDPEMPMSLRMKFQDKFVWPLVKELMEEDIKDKEKQKQGEDGERDDRRDKKSGKPQKGKEQKSEKGGDKKKGAESADPNEVFKDDYDAADKKVPNAVPLEETEKEFKKWREAKRENPLERADKEYAEKLGVKKEALQEYRRIASELERVKDPVTGENVIEELRSLIARIIAERRRPAQAPRYPVEEGEELVDPAELYAQVKAGNLEPKVWETYEIKEKKGKKFGEVEITLVCDRSGSMAGAKLIEQRKAAVLFMEGLKEFADLCDEERVNLEQPLEVRSEIYSFQSSAEDSRPLKKMSKELGEKERIEVASILASAPGGTTDFVPLEMIAKNIDEELARRIKDGEVKKIVIVFTDGESGSPARTQAALKVLREKGVVAVGVGVTASGAAALTTYAPEARLAGQAEDLPVILGDLLKKELAELNG